MSGSRDDEARRSFAAGQSRGTFDGIDLRLLDPADEDDRGLLISAEHPEIARAVELGKEEIEIDGVTLNPGLHLTIHEIVAKQLWEDDPPEVWDTARRPLEAGYERHEILHMVGSALSAQLWAAMTEPGQVDTNGYLRALQVLPASWEQQRRGG